MADYAVTASQVLLISGSPIYAVAGGAVTAGDPVYLDPATGKYLRADANGTATVAGASGGGLALSTADADGSQLVVAGPGCVVNVGAGAAIIVGAVVVVSATAGKLAPTADITTAGHFRTVVGIGGPTVNYLSIIWKYAGAAIA